MARILIVDDHPVVRRGLRQILEAESNLNVVGEAECGSRALELVRTRHWDLAVLDITMPGKSGLEVLRELKQERPKLAILVLSIHPEEQYARRVLKAGAAGYVTKASAPEQLALAVRRILRGSIYVSPSLAEKLAMDLRGDSQWPLHEGLSDREYQVLCLIASGKPIKQIALELQLSAKTISTYRARILEKMKMTSNADLIRYALHNRLVE